MPIGPVEFFGVRLHKYVGVLFLFLTLINIVSSLSSLLVESSDLPRHPTDSLDRLLFGFEIALGLALYFDQPQVERVLSCLPRLLAYNLGQFTQLMRSVADLNFQDPPVQVNLHVG